MIVELKKGYTIESRYDKFTDSYITRLIDPDGKQIKDARYSDDMVDRNYDIQDIKDYFNNYINIGLSEREAPDRNKPYESEEDDDFAELEPEETFEDEEDMFEESLDQEVKKKARKTKIATRKSKLPALSKLSPIMPDQAKGIAKFNAMQPDGNSGMMSTIGSTSLGEEYMSRDLLIDKIRNMGYKYNFDKYTDAQLYRIYQERVETAKKRAAKRAERKQRAAEEDNKRENAKDSYFKDGIEFESEEAAKEYFGESMETKVYLNDMHKAWDMIDPEDEVSIPTNRSKLNESLTKSKDIHNFKTLNEGLSYFNTKAFENNCQDVGLDLMFESVRDKLTKDDIKKLGALMNKTDDPDDVVTYVKGLLSEDLSKEQIGDLGILYDNICYHDLTPTFDYTYDQETGINRNPYDSNKATLTFHINGDMAELDRIIERIENRVEEYGFIFLDSDFDSINRPNGSTWAEGYLFIKVKSDNQVRENFDLDQFKDNLEREKDYYGSRAQGLKMLAYPLNNKIMRAAEKAHLWVDEEDCVIDDLKDEIQLSFYVDGDWKHDHAVFDMLVREIVYDMGMDLNGYYQEDESDSDSDDYRSLHVFEIDASKPNEINESLNESVQRSMIEGDIQIAVDHFREQCRYNNYHAEVTGIGNIDGYYIITGLIEDRIKDTKNPSEVLDILLHNLDMFDIPVNVSTDWQVTRLYRRMVFEISTKDQYNLKNENVTTAEDIDEVQRILKVLNSEGFILDDAVQVPLQMNPFGGSRKMVHFQVINPDLYYPTSETEGEEITEDEAHRLFVDDIKPLVAALDDLESEDDFEGYITFNFGANKDGKITAGLDWRE